MVHPLPESSRPTVEGAQSVSRAISALRAVAYGGRDGLRLTDVAARVRLKTMTTRRLLQALAAEGVLLFDQSTRRYQIGPELIAMAAMADPGLACRDLLAPALREIAEATNDTALLMIRRGDFAVCIDRCDGAFPVRIMTLDVGTVRPLGVGSGSLALLAALPEEERRAVIARNGYLYRRHNLTPDMVREHVEEVCVRGYAYIPGLLVLGIYGLSIPVSLSGQITASINVLAIAERLPKERLSSVLNTMKKAVTRIRGAKAGLT